MDENAQFDLFIAYYGNRTQGTENEAAKLYDALNGISIGKDRYLSCYFHPVTNPHGVFEETPLIVARTPLFLLAVDRNVPRNAAGQLSRQREDGTMRNLFEEVQTFHNSPMYKDFGGEESAKLFIADRFDFREAEQLHPIFSGKVAFTANRDVIAWIRDFYSRTYPDRLYQKAKCLIKTGTAEKFLQGEWVEKAREWWRISRYEDLGKILLIYYFQRRKDGGEYLRNAMDYYRQLTCLPEKSKQTQAILNDVALYLFQ